MNRHLLQRRQLLWYLSLATGTAALSLGFKKVTTLSSTIARYHPNSNNAAAKSGFPIDFSVTAATAPSLPEFQGISQWLNSAPLSVEQLKGKVVLVQFWTFACINCQRTLPYVTRWHRQYAEQGLMVIGVHTPELPFERDVSNVKRALQERQITYPVPIDNEYKTWNAYHNDYWPHLFLADRQSLIRYDHIGEGAYDETEQFIRKLLG
ncbi:MAG: thioredoxin family protein [Chroococcidiopsidaceae cyanobacterium CP_BM_ER_R8_30]|nr:thioredoxin family protein [Chroococcidiopsidaceae cyanobacterium CP_BM_ER_R8_30]